MRKNKLPIVMTLLIATLAINACNSTTTNTEGGGSQGGGSNNGALIVSTSKTKILIGESLKINARKINMEGELTYTSSNPEVAGVTEDGEILGLKVGTAVITIKCADKQGIVNVEVSKGEPTASYTYYDLDRTKVRRHSLVSKGSPKVLVVPVHISGYESNMTQENLDKIKEAFTGKNTCWESVTDFYKKSSYNQLNLDFTIMDEWYDSKLTIEDIYAERKGDDCGTSAMADHVIDWCRDKFNSSLLDYDQDKDGYIDSLWMVYDAPNKLNEKYTVTHPTVDSTLAWAFVTESYLHSDGNVHNPVPKIYGWASYDFMFASGEDKIDAHTYIHETGHMLGLNDYYSYGNNFKTPMGCIDMMDNNVGDHNSFSKYALGWVTPKVIESDTKITISSFEDTGEFLLIPSKSWNQTAFDEYFLVELVTPTGLNEMDYNNAYPENKLKGYDKPGIRIFHVDNRICRAGIGEIIFVHDEMLNYDGQMIFSTPISNTEAIGYTFPYDEESQTIPLRQITLMQKNFDSTKVNVLSDSRAYLKALQSGSIDADNALFHEGESFKLGEGSQYNELMPSNSECLDKYSRNRVASEKFKYTITVEKLDAQSATISIVSK